MTSPPPPALVAPPNSRPGEIAAMVLAQTWMAPNGWSSLPVDAVWIARQLGAQVFTMQLEPDVSGVLLGRPGRPPEIYVNVVDALVRQRFSCAHEIGHLLRRRGIGGEEFGFVDRRDHLSSTGLDDEERWANQFAAALLMPEQAVREAGSTDPYLLAPRFGVSSTAMYWRLRNLGMPTS